MTTGGSFWQSWFPEDRETVRQRYLATRAANDQPSFTGAPKQTVATPAAVQLVNPIEELTNSATKLGVTPLYLAVLRHDVPLATKLLQRPKLASEQVAAHCLPNNKSMLPFAVRRLPQLPSTALELAIALDDLPMVQLLMRHGALLHVPKQLSLDQLADRSLSTETNVCDTTPTSPSFSQRRSLCRGGQQLGALDSLGFSEQFLQDEQVQHTLEWRDYEAALLTQASPGIVEALLRWCWCRISTRMSTRASHAYFPRRQGYQLTLNHASNPYELAQLFETAVAAGNAYVVREMVARGVDVNGLTFRRGQLPLCIAINALQVDVLDVVRGE